MRIFKLLFSRIFVVALLLLLQIGGMALLALWFLDIAVLFQIISLVIGVGVVFSMLARKETPEFKLPWLFLMLTLPAFGVLLYLLFAHPRLSRRKGRTLRAQREEERALLAPSEEERERIAEAPSVPAGLETYLQKTSHTHGTLGNRVSYFPSGEEFFRDLCEHLRGARRFILMEYFIIEEGEMWSTLKGILTEKAKEGVTVRLLYDDIGSAGKIPLSTCRHLREVGIECYRVNPFRPVLSGIYNNRDHRKITVIDGTVGYTGGVNVGDDYINKTKRLGHWKDTAIRIEGPAVRNLTALFLQLFDLTARKKTERSAFLDPLPPAFEDGGWAHPFGAGPRPVYEERAGEGVLLHLIQTAEKSLRITTPYLIPDYTLTSALRDAALRGVKVEILTPHVPDKRVIFALTRSNYRPLLEAGVHIAEYAPGFLHAKTLVADERVALVSTVNFDYRSLVHHFECGALFAGCAAVGRVVADFDRTRALSLELPPDYRPSLATRTICTLLSLFTPLL